MRLIKKYFKLSMKDKSKYVSKVTMLGNFLWGGMKILFGALTLSYFLCISGVYSIGIGFAKNRCLVGYNRGKNDFEKEKKYFNQVSFILILSSILYIGYMVYFLINPTSIDYNIYVSISIALVATVELSFAIYGIVKSRLINDLLLYAMKSINLSSALIAVALAQAALTASSSKNGELTLEQINASRAAGGITFGFLCLVVAIMMFLEKKKFNPLNLVDQETKEVNEIKEIKE